MGVGIREQVFGVLTIAVVVVGGQQSVSCALTANPDVSGIGVRMAYYLQGFYTILAPWIFQGAETESFFRNVFCTTTALTCSMLIYGRGPGVLSVVDGLVVTFLHVINVGTQALNLRRAKWSVRLTCLAANALSAAFSIYFWVTVSTYGDTPGCHLNATAKFVLFGRNLSMANQGLRIFALVFFSGFASQMVVEAGRIVRHRGEDDHKERERESRYKLNLLVLPLWVYAVVTIEQIIQRNGVGRATNKWTYGQTLSVALLLSPTLDVCMAAVRRLRGDEGGGPD